MNISFIICYDWIRIERNGKKCKITKKKTDKRIENFKRKSHSKWMSRVDCGLIKRNVWKYNNRWGYGGNRHDMKQKNENNMKQFGFHCKWFSNRNYWFRCVVCRVSYACTKFEIIRLGTNHSANYSIIIMCSITNDGPSDEIQLHQFFLCHCCLD